MINKFFFIVFCSSAINIIAMQESELLSKMNENLRFELTTGSTLIAHYPLLSKALHLGWVEGVEFLLRNGVIFNTDAEDNGEQAMPLVLAVERSNIPLLSFLIDYGFSVEHTKGWEDTPLLRAVKLKSSEMISFLLLKKATIFSNDGLSPLLEATRYGYIDVLKHLLVRYLDLDNAEDSLMFGCIMGDRSLVEAAIDKKVDLNSTKYIGTPLFYAIYYDHVSLIPLLIASGANIKVQTMENETVLGWAKRSAAQTRNLAKNYEVLQFIKLFLQEDIQDYFKNKEKIYEEHVRLLKKGIQPRFKGKQTLLMLLALSNDKARLCELLDLPLPLSYLHAQDETGYTAIMYAAKADNHEIVMELLNRGCLGIWQKNNYGKTALEYAAFNNNLKTFTRIRETGSDQLKKLAKSKENKIHLRALIRSLNICVNNNYQSLITHIILYLFLQHGIVKEECSLKK